MKQLKSYKPIVTYFCYIIVLFFILLLIVNNINIKTNDNVDNIKTSTIKYNDEYTDINVNYPRFKSDNLNAIITKIIYNYIKEFKSFDTIKKALEIDYNIYYIDNYVNITFDIENTINSVNKKNILIDIKNEKLSYISDLYDKNYLENEINSLVFHKYQYDIYEKIKNSNINNHTYEISDKKIVVYFNDISFNEIDYIPSVEINLIKEAFEYEENYNNKGKYIILTFDDGPSEYTNDLLNILNNNNSSATFFMLGNRMKNNVDIIKNIYNSNSEIGSHSYLHNDLTNYCEEELIEDFNTVNIIYNEITNDNIKYFRPPYGKYNENIKNNINIPIVLWNIDPKDWLLRDSIDIYNNVINNACNGCIILLHETYKETVEALKMIIPKLNELGYKTISLSEALELENINLDNNDVISYIKSQN